MYTASDGPAPGLRPIRWVHWSIRWASCASKALMVLRREDRGWLGVATRLAQTGETA